MEGSVPVDVVESKKTTIKFDNLKNLVEKLRKSEVPHTIDTKLGRIYVDKDVIGAVAKDVGGCKVLLKEAGVEGEIKDVQLRDGVTICAPKKDIEKFRETLMKSEGYNKIKKVKDHPMLKLTLAKNYKYVNLLDVEELADRGEGFVPKDAIPFKTLLPLYEIISHTLKINQLYSKKVLEIQNKLIERFGNELKVLLEAKPEELGKVVDKKIVENILKVREGKVRFLPGYDGEYGKPLFNDELIIRKTFSSQKALTDFSKP